MKKKARQARQTIKNVDEAVLKAVNRTFFPYLREDFPAMPGGGKRDRERSASDPSLKKVDNKETPPKPTTSITLTEEEKNLLEVEDENQIVENLDEETLLNLSASNKEQGTYSSAAKKPKVDQDLMLYVQKGTEKREVISKTLFNAFCDNFSDKLFSDEKMFLSVNIDWTDHHLGRGLIACLDKDTAAWVKAQAEAFSFEGQTIRAWSRYEFGSRIVYQGFLHSSYWWGKNGPSELAKILRLNKISGGNFQLISFQKRQKGVFIRWEADDALAQQLDQHKSLNCGRCRLLLEKKIHKSAKSAEENMEY